MKKVAGINPQILLRRLFFRGTATPPVADPRFPVGHDLSEEVVEDAHAKEFEPARRAPGGRATAMAMPPPRHGGSGGGGDLRVFGVYGWP